MKYNTPDIQKQITNHIKNNISGYAVVRNDDERRRIPSPSGLKLKLYYTFRYYNKEFKFKLMSPSQLHPFDYSPTTYKRATDENVVYAVEILDIIDAEQWSRIMTTLNREINNYIVELMDFKISKLDRRLLVMIDKG